MAFSQKLADAFNKHARKIISTEEFADLWERKKSQVLAQNPDAVKMPASAGAANSSQSTLAFSDTRALGIYQSIEKNKDGLHEIFIDIQCLGILFPQSPVPPGLQDAYAEAVEEIRDCRPDIRTGKLKLEPAII